MAVGRLCKDGKREAFYLIQAGGFLILPLSP